MDLLWIMAKFYCPQKSTIPKRSLRILLCNLFLDLNSSVYSLNSDLHSLNESNAHLSDTADCAWPSSPQAESVKSFRLVSSSHRLPSKPYPHSHSQLSFTDPPFSHCSVHLPRKYNALKNSLLIHICLFYCRSVDAIDLFMHRCTNIILSNLNELEQKKLQEVMRCRKCGRRREVFSMAIKLNAAKASEASDTNKSFRLLGIRLKSI